MPWRHTVAQVFFNDPLFEADESSILLEIMKHINQLSHRLDASISKEVYKYQVHGRHLTQNCTLADTSAFENFLKSPCVHPPVYVLGHGDSRNCFSSRNAMTASSTVFGVESDETQKALWFIDDVQ